MKKQFRVHKSGERWIVSKLGASGGWEPRHDFRTWDLAMLFVVTYLRIMAGIRA